MPQHALTPSIDNLVASNNEPAPPTIRPWMRMVWHDLLFMHWPVDSAQLSRLIPAGVTLDTFDGRAWISVVPFRMTGVSLCGCPDLPGVSRFPELNVRTYVTDGERPGVWFFSLDATSRFAVRMARWLYFLPYMDARISLETKGEWIRYRSQRQHRGEPHAALDIEYRPLGSSRTTWPGSLEHWLTARYWMYLHDRRDRWYLAAVEHAPWQLQDAQVLCHNNQMLQWLGIDVGQQPPLTQFARRTDVRAGLRSQVSDVMRNSKVT